MYLDLLLNGEGVLPMRQIPIVINFFKKEVEIFGVIKVYKNDYHLINFLKKIDRDDDYFLGFLHGRVYDADVRDRKDRRYRGDDGFARQGE